MISVYLLLDFGILHQLFRCLACLFVDFGQVAEPKHLHLLPLVVVRSELGQFDEDESQPFDDFPGLGFFHNLEVVVIPFAVREGVVHEVQRVDGLQQFVVFPLVQLADVCFRRVEQDALLVCRSPHHLHLYDELPSALVLASHVHDAVFVERRLRNHFGVQVLHLCNLFFGFSNGSSAFRKLIIKSGCSPNTFLKVRSALGLRYLIIKKTFSGRLFAKIRISVENLIDSFGFLGTIFPKSSCEWIANPLFQLRRLTHSASQASFVFSAI